MNDSTLQLIWAIQELGRYVGKETSINDNQIKIGVYTYDYSHCRLDEALIQCLKLASAYYALNTNKFEYLKRSE